MLGRPLIQNLILVYHQSDEHLSILERRALVRQWAFRSYSLLFPNCYSSALKSGSDSAGRDFLPERTTVRKVVMLVLVRKAAPRGD